MLEESIKNIILLLDDVIVCLDGLTEENFDELYPRIVLEMKEVYSLKQILKSSFGGEMLGVYNEELNTRTKLIREKFDNILKYKEREQAEILMQLQQMQNQRKLANYR